MEGISASRKKSRLGANSGTILDNFTSDLAKVDFKSNRGTQSFWDEGIATLKPGIGLLGNAEEEKAYYEEYEKTANNEAGDHDNIGAADPDREESDHQHDDDDDDDRESEIVFHKPSKKEKDEEYLGHYEDGTFGSHYFEDENGEHILMTDYLGGDWVDHIDLSTILISWRTKYKLYNVDPMETPPYMTIVPHKYQLMAAAQAQLLSNTRFKGMLLGDDMGVGKTLSAILTMYKRKDEPGFSLVVCPKTLCRQWASYIEGSFIEGHALKVYVLEGSSSVTAHELDGMGVDIVVASYEQIDASERAMRNLPTDLDHYNNDLNDPKIVQQPKRPNAVLHSPYWGLVGRPIKWLVCDEVQVINKRRGIRHKAVKALNYSYFLGLSGTLMHNKWHNFSGYLDYLSGLPIHSHKEFIRAFTTFELDGNWDRPDLEHIRLLQRFLQAFTIARPRDVLNLSGISLHKAFFTLSPETVTCVEVEIKNHNQFGNHKMSGGEDSDDGHVERMGFLVKAQLHTLHQMLVPEVKFTVNTTGDFVDVDDDPQPMMEYTERGNADTAELPEEFPAEDRDNWLARIKHVPDLYQGGNRLRHFLKVYQTILKAMPGEKIVVFSQYLKFLDLCAEVLLREFGVVALRYDGTVAHKHRTIVERQFEAARPEIPLMLTAGAGGYGLNITHATVVVLTEVWWNANAQAQAVCRVWRQKQEKPVTVVQLFAENSPIDAMMYNAQKRKNKINRELMEAIVRSPGEQPDIRELRVQPILPTANYRI